MKDIKDFFLKILKEKHIVNNIFKYYYEDWEENKIKILKKDIRDLEKKIYHYRTPIYKKKMLSQYLNEKEKKLFILRYNNIKKFENIGKEMK